MANAGFGAGYTANPAGVKGIASGLDVTRVLPCINNDWAAQNSPGQDHPTHSWCLSQNWGSAPASAEGFAAAQRWCWALGPWSLVFPQQACFPQGQHSPSGVCSASCRYLGQMTRVGPCCWDAQTFLVKLQPAWTSPGCAGGQQDSGGRETMAAAASFRNWCPAKLQHWQEALQGAETVWHSSEEEKLQPRGTWGHSEVAEIHGGFHTRLAHSKLRALHDRNVTCPSF